MKKIYPLIICLLIISIGWQTTSAQNTFEKTYFEGTGKQVYQTPDDGFLIIANDKVIKTDANGNELEILTIDNPLNHYVPTDDGGFIKTGTVDILGDGQTDIVLIKTDENGVPTWTKNIGTDKPEQANAVYPTADGGYIIAGAVEQEEAWMSPVGIDIFSDDMLFLKTDAMGNEQWRQVVGAIDRNEEANMVIETLDGNFVATGLGGLGPVTATSLSSLYLAKVDATGNVLYTDLRGSSVGSGANQHFANSLNPTADGGYLMSGFIEVNSPIFSGPMLFVEKSDGTSDWGYSYGGFPIGFGEAFGAAETPDGGAIVTCEMNVTKEGALLKLDASGTEEWLLEYPLPGNDIIVTSDGGYAITGEIGGLVNLVKTNSQGEIATCPDAILGFSLLGEIDGHQYFLSNEKCNWQKAHDIAVTHGGYLASIDDANENDFLQQNIYEQVFIGLNDRHTEGNLEWDSGQPFNYSNLSNCTWCGLNNEDNDFGKMNFWDGSWSFDNRWVERSFIMEVECSSDCGCPTDYNPVCGSDDVTYLNACVAECEGKFDYTLGECQTTCPIFISGYEFLGEWDGHHYFLSESEKPWWMAETDALSIGGYLATVGSAAENDFLQQNISEIVWFGMTDSNTEGQVEWSNGEPLTYTNYSDCDFCGDNSEVRDYGEMNFWDGSWSWDNGTPYRKYLVEIPCMSTTFNNSAVNIAVLETTEEEEKAQTVVEKLFPNPATNHLFAKIESTTETEISLQVYDALGSLHLEKNTTLFKGRNHLELDISELPSGVYMLFVKDSKRQISQMKFIKQQM